MSGKDDDDETFTTQRTTPTTTPRALLQQGKSLWTAQLSKLDLPSRYSETKQRVSQGVSELDLPSRYVETKQRVSRLDLPSRYMETKQRVSQSMAELKLDEKVVNTSKQQWSKWNIDQKLAHSRDAVKRNASTVSEQLQKLNLQKLNLGSLIDKLERDQHLADDLERKNRDFLEEQVARDMMRDAERACQAAIASHLHQFIAEHPTGTYEEWIQELHPENLQEGKLLTGLGKELDHRLYVQESDHRILWNQNLGNGTRREVLARSRMNQKPSDHPVVVDLLDETHAAAPTAATTFPSYISIPEQTDEDDMEDVDLVATTTPAPTDMTPTSILENNLLFDVETTEFVKSRSAARNGLHDKVNDLLGEPQLHDQVAPWVSEASSTGGDDSSGIFFAAAAAATTTTPTPTTHDKNDDLISFS